MIWTEDSNSPPVQEIVKASETTTNVPTGITLYEANKSIIRQLPTVIKDSAIEVIYQFQMDTMKKQGDIYSVLLGWDLRYFTVFVDNNYDKTFCEEVYGCLSMLGEIKSIEYEDDKVECWIADKEDMFVLYLFNYEGGVIEC